MTSKQELVLQIKADVEDIKSKLNGLSNQKIESPFKNWVADLSHIYISATAIVETLKNLPITSLIQTGFKFNSIIEQTRIGFAGILTSIAEIKDSYGRVLEGQEKFNQALAVAEKIQGDLQTESLKSVATYEELVQIAQGIAAPFLSAGGNVKELSKFTVLISNAVKAIGLDGNQAVQEARDLLSGTIDMNSQLARSLGITNEIVENWKEQGVLFQELQNRLKGFELAGVELQSSWEGLISNAKDFFTVIASEVSKPLFDKIKQDLKTLIDYFIVIKDGKIEIRDEARQKIEAIKNSLISLYETVKNISVAIVEFTQRFEALILIFAKTFILIKIFERFLDIVNALKTLRPPDITIKESPIVSSMSELISNIGKLILALSNGILATLKKMPFVGAIVSALENTIEKVVPIGLKIGTKIGGAITTGVKLALSNIGVVIFTAITAYDFGKAFWDWLDKSLNGAVTRFAQKVLYFIDKIITEIRGVIGKLPFGSYLGGLSEKELEEKRRVLQIIRDSIQYEGKEKPNVSSSTQSTTKQFPDISVKLPTIDVEKRKQENALLSDRLQLLEKTRRAYLDLYQTQIEVSTLKDTEKIVKKIEVEFYLEENNYKDTLETLSKRKEELEKLLQTQITDKDRAAIKTELQNIYRQIEQADLDHYFNRLNIVNQYSKQIVEALKNLNREIKEVDKERGRDLQNLDSQVVSIKNRIFEPLKNLPSSIKYSLSQLAEIDLFGFSGFGSGLKQLQDSYGQFFAALRSGAGIETLKELKNGFLEARNSMLSFLQGVNPKDFTELIKIIGLTPDKIIQGFSKYGSFTTIDNFEQVVQKLSKIFDLNIPDAKNIANGLVESMIQAKEKVKEIISTIPGITSYIPQDQLFGMQMQSLFTEKISASLKQKTQDIYKGLQDTLKEQASSLEKTLSDLTVKLSENSKISIKLDTSILDKQYQEIVSKIQSTTIEIPVRFKTLNEGQYR